MTPLQTMTLYEMLSLVISIAGFIAVVITLILLMRQTREMTAQTKYVAESLQSNAYESLLNQVFSVNQVFIDSPELRQYFRSGKVISENDASYDKVIAIADLLLDFIDSLMQHAHRFPEMWPHQWWKEYAIDSFAKSQILCSHLESIKDLYSDDLIVLMRSGEARRQQSKI
jgi:hypothetical protein